MAIDASEVLGSAQLAGVKVNPFGFGKRTAGRFGGAGAGAGVGALGAGAGSASTPGRAWKSSRNVSIVRGV